MSGSTWENKSVTNCPNPKKLKPKKKKEKGEFKSRCKLETLSIPVTLQASSFKLQVLHCQPSTSDYLVELERVSSHLQEIILKPSRASHL